MDNHTSILGVSYLQESGNRGRLPRTNSSVGQNSCKLRILSQPAVRRTSCIVNVSFYRLIPLDVRVASCARHALLPNTGRAILPVSGSKDGSARPALLQSSVAHLNHDTVRFHQRGRRKRDSLSRCHVRRRVSLAQLPPVGRLCPRRPFSNPPKKGVLQVANRGESPLLRQSFDGLFTGCR